ncbi:EF-hand domain-containing protein [Streptomyces sp. NPDC101490]|uniref:EF-hand domain-containing protein n=1 Tax=Streptomyces sp. NPDC101490 TaxID=3366143 RepID=UPI003828AB89
MRLPLPFLLARMATVAALTAAALLPLNSAALASPAAAAARPAAAAAKECDDPPPEQIAVLQKAFNYLDSEHKGYLTPAEAVIMLAAAGVDLTEAQVEDLVDENHDGKIEFAEIVHYLTCEAELP